MGAHQTNPTWTEPYGPLTELVPPPGWKWLQICFTPKMPFDLPVVMIVMVFGTIGKGAIGEKRLVTATMLPGCLSGLHLAGKAVNRLSLRQTAKNKR